MDSYQIMKQLFRRTKILNFIFYPILLSNCSHLASIFSHNSECGDTIVGMSCIPSGEFIRGSNVYESNEKPESRIYLDSYYIDLYEVTNEDFQKCLDSGGCRQCLKTGKCKKITPNYGARYSEASQPVVGLSWYSAKEYCEFLGKRLPTEAEWEKAARGSDGEIFPWGNERATCLHAIIEEDGRKGCVKQKISPIHHMTTQKVGSRPAYRYGLYDMAGNSWEWVADWYSNSYEECGLECQGKNPRGACANLESCEKFGNKKIVKGGAWWWPSDYARSSRRRPHVPENFPEYHHFGFRCAK